MKKLNLAVLFLISTFPLFAAERSESEMEAIALQQLKGAGVKSLANQFAAKLKCLQRNTAFSIYGTEDNDGFVIVSSDDEVRPVLGYSTSSFDANNIPCGLQWWMENVSSEIEKVKRAPRQGKEESLQYVPIAPFLETKWGQNDPYNRLTPEFDSANGKQHAVTGCVATALAQILNYNQYPSSASFEGLYYMELSSQKEEINSTYEWPCKIAYGNYWPDGYQTQYDWKTIEYTDEEAVQIATLLRDCGYSVKMQYGLNASSASAQYSANALINCFQYPKAAVKAVDREWYTDTEWMQMVYDELMKKSPILYAGQDPVKGAHAFLLHGIDEKGLVYVNWGWVGANDGYYAIDGFSSDAGSFNSNQNMVIGLRPQALSSDKYSSLFIMNEPYVVEWHPEYSTPLLVSFESCTNSSYDASPFIGDFAFVAEDQTDGTVILTPYDRITFSENGCPYGSGWLDPGNYFKIEFAPNHSYKFYMAAKATDEVNYSPIYVARKGRVYYNVTTDSEGTPTFSEPQYIPTVVRSAKQTETDGIARVYDLQGRLLQSTSATSISSCKMPRGLSIVKQGNRVRKIAGRAQ